MMAEDVLPHFDEAEMHHTTGALTFGGEGGYIHVFHVDELRRPRPGVAAGPRPRRPGGARGDGEARGHRDPQRGSGSSATCPT